MEGRIFGRYRVTEKIGEGGMAEVYAARHELMGREAAVKLLLPQMSHAHIVKRFFQEAQAAARINHPGIVGVFDVGHTEDGRAYIVMERLSGETLSARLDRIGTMALDDTLQVIRQLAGVMKAAHERGIVHRDLKPDNLFLVEDPVVEGGERVKVLDFGLAKLAEHTGSVLTAKGMVFGTPGYMAPEQCRDSGKVDERADLYSIGCIMYRCLCGRPPFGGAGLDVLKAHLNTPPVPPRDRDPTIPAAIDALILRLLEKSPDRRVRSCTELLTALDTGEVPKQDTFIDDQGARTHDITLVEAGQAGPAFEAERITDADAEPVRLPGVVPRHTPGQALVDPADAADPADPADDEITLLATTRNPAADMTTLPYQGPGPAALSNSAPGAYAQVRHGTANSAAASKAQGQRHTSRQGRTWLLWGGLGLVLVMGSMAAVLMAGAGGGGSAGGVGPAPQVSPKPTVQPESEPTAGPAEAARARDMFNEHIKKAEELQATEAWNESLAELEPAIKLADEHDLDGTWPRHLQQRATQELKYQAVFERFAEAQGAGDVDTAVRASRAIPEESVYREKVSSAFAELREGWLDKARSQAKKLIRRGACDEVDALVQQAESLFPEDSSMRGLPKECARRQAKDSEAKQQKHKELVEEARKVYKQGEYGRAYRVCSDAHELAPGDKDTTLLCGMAACRLKNQSAASSFHSRLTAQEQRKLQQICIKEGVKLIP